MARAKVLQWPLVRPLSKRREKAHLLARTIAQAGELRIVGVEDHHIGFVRLVVFPRNMKDGWYINIRPVHFGGYDAKVFDFNMHRYIEFEYCPRGVTENAKWRHPWDPSTYLTIKSVR
jgi:hypothetical protein